MQAKLIPGNDAEIERIQNLIAGVQSGIRSVNNALATFQGCLSQLQQHNIC